MSAVLFLSLLAGAAGWTHSVPRVSAASYDYYVKDGENGDGSEDDPFGSLKDAIDEIGSDKGKRVYVHPGSYAGGVTIPKGTKLVGADAKTVTITGELRLEDDVDMEKLGFSGAGSIVVSKNAHVTLEKVRFKDIVGTAIKSDPGSAEVVIRDSLIEKARKGMYLQAGTTLQASDLEVVQNLEEGIDIRENVNGSIQNSDFRDNKESGVEIVLGSSNFNILNNTFSGNGASGVVAQYYASAKKLGKVRIEGNTFSKNDWGVDCKAPQGKMESKFYFLNSLTIQNNTYKENRDGEIASRCKVMTDEERLAYEAEEAKRKQAEEDRVAALSLSEAATADRMAKAAAARQDYETVQTEREAAALDASLTELEAGIRSLVERSSAWRERSSWRCYLVGPGYAERATLSRSRSDLARLIDRWSGEAARLRFETNQTKLELTMAEARAALSELEQAPEPACGFSLFGWAAQALAARSPEVSLFASALTERPVVPIEGDQRLFYLGDMSYYPKVREQVVRQGDEWLLGKVKERLRGYAAVGASLPLPIVSELDPLPAAAAKAPLSFPFRFANIFGGANLRWMDLPANRLYTGNPDAYRKTSVQLGYAGIAALGSPETRAPYTVWLGDQAVTLVFYREALPATLESALQALQTASRPAIAMVAWDDTRKTSADERRELLERLVAAGADLVIGHGLNESKSVSTVGAVQAYRSLGSVWRDYENGNPATNEAVGLEIKVAGDGLEVVEKKLSVTLEGGLSIAQ